MSCIGCSAKEDAPGGSRLLILLPAPRSVLGYSAYSGVDWDSLMERRWRRRRRWSRTGTPPVRGPRTPGTLDQLQLVPPNNEVVLVRVFVLFTV